MVDCINKMVLKIISIVLCLGILITNQSLVNLFTDLQLNYPKVKYIMTRKLNQDFLLENLFSYLKGMTGSNTHLSPLDFMHW